MSTSRLARIELSDGNGHALPAADVLAWPLRIGRALDNDLVLDDPHVAAHHAVLQPDAQGQLVLQLLDGRNGALLEADGPREQPALPGTQVTLAALSRWRLGTTSLRVRRAEDAVADELPMALQPPTARRWLTPVLLALLLAWNMVQQWLAAGEQTTWTDYLAQPFGMVTALLLWLALWGLLAKIFSGRFTIAPYLRLTLIAALAEALLGLLLPALAFALDLPLLSRLRTPAATIVGAVLVAVLLGIVVPRHARRLRAAVAVVVMLGFGIQLAAQWQRRERLSGELYADVLMPPALRLVPATPVPQFTERLRALEEPLRKRVQRAQDEEFEP